jgi:hypothetical protein
MAKKYGIGVISGSCGILPQTLRAWEQRYAAFKPERSDGGQRLYSEDDLKKAKYLALLIDQGHSISRLASYSLEELSTMTEDLYVADSSYQGAVTIRKLIHYIESYLVDEIVSELQHLRMSLGTKEFIFNVVLPSLCEVGELYIKGKYTVTQEHVISALLRHQLSQLYLPNWQHEKNMIALATPEGNIHELPIIIADVLCRANRVSTRFLGASHPAESLADAMNMMKCSSLVLGSTSSSEWDFEAKMIPYLDVMDKTLTKKITIILGGVNKVDLPKFAMIEKVICMNSFETFDKYLHDFI